MRNRCLGIADLEEALECSVHLPMSFKFNKLKQKKDPPDQLALDTAGKALNHILCQHPEIKHAEITVIGKRALFYFTHGHTSTQALMDNEDLHEYNRARKALERVVAMAE